MAGGAIVSVDPLDQPGVYRAKLADGSSMMLHGPSGEALAKRYAPSESAMGPNATADASDVVGSLGRVAAYTNPLTAPAALTYDIGKKVAGAFSGGSPTPAGAPTQSAAPAQPGQAAPTPEDILAVARGAGAQQQAQPVATAEPAQTAAGPLGYTMQGIDPATGQKVVGAAVRDAQGNVGILVPGSRGTPGGMTALGKSAVKNTAEAEKEHARQTALEDLAAQRGAEAAMAANREEQAFNIERQKQIINEAKQQQDEVDKQTAAVEKLQAGYQAARDDFMNSKVDPDQYLKSNKAVSIFSALGVMLNQFGSAFTHQPNIAAEFVNQQIDRNIRMQEAQLNVKGKAADNMLADLTRQTGDMKLAKVAMKQMLTERAALEAANVGLSSKNQQIKANADAVSAKLAGDAALQDNARKQGFLEHVMTNPLYYRHGTAGSAPRVALPTMEQVKAGQDMGIDQRKLGLDEAKFAAQTAKEKAEAGKDKVGFRGQASIAAARVARGAVAEFADTLGMKRGPDGKYLPPSWGAIAQAKLNPVSNESQGLAALQETLPSEINKAQTGGTTTEGGMAAMHQQIKKLRTPGDYAAFANHYDHTMHEVERQQRLTAGTSHDTGTEPAEEADR